MDSGLGGDGRRRSLHLGNPYCSTYCGQQKLSANNGQIWQDPLISAGINRPALTSVFDYLPLRGRPGRRGKLMCASSMPSSWSGTYEEAINVGGAHLSGQLGMLVLQGDRSRARAVGTALLVGDHTDAPAGRALAQIAHHCPAHVLVGGAMPHACLIRTPSRNRIVR